MTIQTGKLTDDVRAECEATIGRTRVVADSMAPEPAAKMAVLMGCAAPDLALPPMWHWIYFNIGIAAEHQGRDLHEETGRFLPAAPFPRRMWAAGDVTVHEPLRIGMPAERRSKVTDVAFKEGKSGAMCFVTITHKISQDNALAIEEKQTVVYRDRGAPDPGLRGPGDPVPDGYMLHTESQLYFYSAVTHNGHRIHWDRDFCRVEEGYPDLVVHGPLMATELCMQMHEGSYPYRFRFRAQAPVFLTTPVRYLPGEAGTPREGRIERSDGVTSMSGTLTTP
ncbi:acyl-CoA dehydrogenase [Pseudohalocynthiibacter aestuariivivens]|nr:MaoC family dehydratase N-terminal domain-containing protein [Pseudohalocynthiibacter aestuariivivens]QIE46493.1 acyl-CoA dehydrogenase [Pseudohalocynthiibacter aestuariivivens]